MRKVITVLLVGAVVFGIALLGCSGSQDVKSAWIGKWDVSEMSGDGQEVTSDQVQALRVLGMDMYLQLDADGKLTLVLGDEAVTGAWEADSATAGSIEMNGQKTEMTLSDGTLKITASGTTISFVKSESSSAKAASEPSASAAVSKSSSDSATPATGASSSQNQVKRENTLGSTIKFDGLDITFGDALSTATVENQFSDHAGQTVIVIPVSIANSGNSTKGLNMFAVKEFGPQGTELDRVFTYFDNDIRNAGDLRPGASMDGSLCFLYDGNGDYYLTFGFYSTDVEVKIPVSL